MVILTNKAGNELKVIRNAQIDVDLNSTRDFELTISASEWNEAYAYGNRIFVPETEYGGIIGRKKISTSDSTVKLRGHCWRGLLAKKIIRPPKGQAYRVVSGELNNITNELIAAAGVSDIFSASLDDSGATVTEFQLDRYITLLEGLEKIYKSKGYRLNIEYIQRERGASGYVMLSALPVTDHSNAIELSQDSKLVFTLDETKDGVNHLICLGKGELTDRIVVDLYIQEDGTVGTTQFYFGQEEIAEVYENTSAETEADLIEQGTERLLENTNKQEFKSDIASLDIEVEIGDIIGGRDYVTGMSVRKSVVNKIYNESYGRISKEYKLEGDEQ